MNVIPPEMEPLSADGAEPDKGLLRTVEAWITFCTKVLFWIAGIALVVMTALIVADVIGIKVFSKPVPGGIEYVSFLAVVSIAFAVAYTQVMRGHIAVDFIVEAFPRRLRLVVQVFTTLLSLVVVALLAVYSFKYAGVLHSTGEVSMTEQIPFYPFVYGMAVAFAVTLLVLLLQLVTAVLKVGQQWTR